MILSAMSAVKKGPIFNPPVALEHKCELQTKETLLGEKTHLNNHNVAQSRTPFSIPYIKTPERKGISHYKRPSQLMHEGNMNK